MALRYNPEHIYKEVECSLRRQLDVERVSELLTRIQHVVGSRIYGYLSANSAEAYHTTGTTSPFQHGYLEE